MDFHYDILIENQSFPNARDTLEITPSPFTRLYYLKSGGCHITSSDAPMPLAEECTLLISPFSFLSITPVSSAEFSVFSYCPADEQFSFRKTTQFLIADERSALSDCLREYLSIPEPSDFPSGILKKSLEYAVIYHAENSFSATPLPISVTLLPAITYIENNLNQVITIAQLANVCRVSESSICKLFRSDLNESPQQFIKRRRMMRAVVLLTRTDRKLSDISYETGFYDQYYFSKEFKKFFGVSPINYKKNHQKN